MENVPHDEAMSLLKTSNLSLTVLKPSVSINSSQRSQIFNDDDKGTTTLPLASVSAISPRLANSSRLRNNTSPSLSLEEEIDKILSIMCTEGSRDKNGFDKKQIAKSNIDGKVISNQRNSYFMSSVSKHQDTAPAIYQPSIPCTVETTYVSLRRPKSAQGSKVSSASSSSRHSFDFSRMTPSSPLNMNRADPLAFSPRSSMNSESLTMPTKHFRPTSMILSNTSGSKSLNIQQKGRPPFRGTYLPTYQDSSMQNRSRRAISEVFDSQSNILRKQFKNVQPIMKADQQFGTFPGKYVRLDLLQNNGFKAGGYKSGSSHGSLNSSDFSDKAVSSNLGNIESVHEETLESLQEFSQINSLESKNQKAPQCIKSHRFD